MGNSNTKEARHDPRALRPTVSSEQGQSSSHPSGHDGRSHGRAGRTDLSGLLGIQQGSNTSERRETRQEREARRLERERQARLVDRERSMREEHVDGGYLVTLGTYVGTEDFNKTVVRQLQIDRRLAPFWRGLQDFSDTWTEYQIVAAARGLDIPPPDQPPPEGFLPQHPSSPNAGDQHHLAVPGDRCGAAAATPGPSAASTSASVPTGALAGTSSPSLSLPATPGSSRTSSSPFRPRAKAIAAALSVSSRNGSSTDLTPRETALAHDPFVNGQPIEVFLYKNATECPICFLTYPPYLNHTRCCDQPICSECFVQIKRAEPHYPEGHGDHHENQEANPEEQAGLLISEPSSCPYCQQPEFGVTYEPPPFRRGLSYASNAPIGSMATAMSSTSTINSTVPGSLAVPGGASPPTSRRRTQSLSATAPNVVTTDRIRPDWSTKLTSQRAHIARRAAAATALHTAAFLMGSEQRTFRVGRFGRWATSSSNQRESDASPARGHSDGGESGDGTQPTMEPGPRSSSGLAVAGAGGIGSGNGNNNGNGSGRRSRMEDLEELMFREALRQSLATEDERRRKEEKEQRKDAKRREKEERKAAKAASKQQGGGSSLYAASGGSGHSSASASSLSLSGIGIGRRRGNSGASNLRVEASVANAMAARGSGSGSSSSSPAAAAGDGTARGSADGATTGVSSAQAGAGDKGKRVDRGTTAASVSGAVPASAPGGEGEGEGDSARTAAMSSGGRHIPSPQPSAGPSHLRQMSSASSVSSSPSNSAMGLQLQDPRASGLSLGSRSGGSDDGGEHSDERDPSASIEPMFNFSSLAELVGVQLEGENAGRRLSAIARDQGDGKAEAAAGTGMEARKKTDAPVAHGEHVEVAEARRSLERLVTELDKNSSAVPEVRITPGTPAPSHEFD